MGREAVGQRWLPLIGIMDALIVWGPNGEFVCLRDV